LWQLDQIIERVNRLVPVDAPLIIAGDFNDWRQKLSDEMAQHLKCMEVFQTLHREHAATFPVWLPMLKLDRIYCRNLKPTHAEVFRGKPWTSLSDHAPILAEFELA
jgi:endonuclease/exonuclease/phosphatase family metal-dependent hydrolase